MSNYAVVRTDAMSGTVQGADLFSFRYYDSLGEEADLENGTIVKLGVLEDGEREVYQAVTATSSDSLRDCVLVAGVEVMYEDSKRNLDEFINEAGTIVRGYALRSRNMFSITPEGFATETMPVVGDTVGIGADGKLDVAGSGFGTCVAIEIVGRHTYYVISIGATEA